MMEWAEIVFCLLGKGLNHCCRQDRNTYEYTKGCTQIFCEGVFPRVEILLQLVVSIQSELKEMLTNTRENTLQGFLFSL